MVYNFNTDLALEELVNWLKKIGERDNFNKVVLGISGVRIVQLQQLCVAEHLGLRTCMVYFFLTEYRATSMTV